MRPPDAEALITEEAFEHEEFLPYWAELWSSAVALAHDVSLRSLRGRPTLELGCGLGLPSIAAARAGGRVLATDWSPEAVQATAANAERNGLEVETLLCSWAEPDAIVERGPWPLVLASDVLYEARNVELLLGLLPRLVDRHRAGAARRSGARAGRALPRRRRGARLEHPQRGEPARGAGAHPPPRGGRAR